MQAFIRRTLADVDELVRAILNRPSTQRLCWSRMNSAGCTSALVPRSAVCPTERKMEPQITQNTQRAAVPYRARTMRLISRRGLPKLSSRQRCKPVAFR